MRYMLWIFMSAFFMANFLAVSFAAEAGDPHLAEDYIIGPGDILDISHWQNESLTKTVIVLPDGKFSFPLIGEITAGGKTVTGLKKELEEKIVRFVPDPVLSVVVQQVNSLVIYVIGKVQRPGYFPLKFNINIMQALSMAGGLNSFANKGKIKIFRADGDGTVIFPFDYDDVADGEHLETNILLRRGDVIVVP